MLTPPSLLVEWFSPVEWNQVKFGLHVALRDFHKSLTSFSSSVIKVKGNPNFNPLLVHDMTRTLRNVILRHLQFFQPHHVTTDSYAYVDLFNSSLFCLQCSLQTAV